MDEPDTKPASADSSGAALAKPRSLFEVWTPIVAAVIAAVASVAVAYISLGGKVDQNSKRLQALSITDLQVGRELLGEIKDGPSWRLAKTSPQSPDRLYSEPVLFKHPFTSPPVITIGISALDAGESHIRVLVYPSDITIDGFDMNVQTWNTSTVSMVTVDWTAIETVYQKQ
jgi:hypothetical protein